MDNIVILFLLLIKLLWVSLHLSYGSYGLAVNCLFFMMGYVPCTTNHSRAFISCSIRFCQRSFLHLMRWSYGFCLSVCLYGGLPGDLCIVNLPYLHLLDEAYLTMVDNLFDVFLGLVCTYFIIFASMFIRKIVL